MVVFRTSASQSDQPFETTGWDIREGLHPLFHSSLGIVSLTIQHELAFQKTLRSFQMTVSQKPEIASYKRVE